MAYFHVDPTPLAPSAASGSFAVDISGYEVAADDYVVIPVICSATAGTVSESSGGGTTWTLITLYVGSGCRMVLAYAKVAAGPTISNPTFSLSSGTGMWQGSVAVVRDADATTFSDGSITDDPGSAVTSDTTGAMTPGNNDALVLYFVSVRASGSVGYARFLPSDVVGEVRQVTDDGTIFTGFTLGTVQQKTAAATAKTFYCSASRRTGSIVFAIKNKTSGRIHKHGTAGITRLAWLGDFGAQHDSNISSWGTPTSRTINGISVSATGATRTSATVGPNEWGQFENFSTAVASAVWQGSMATFSADTDLTGKLFSCEFFSALFGLPVGNEGIIAVFEDNAGTNWAAFQLTQKLGFELGPIYTAVIDVNNATPYDSGGTLDWSLFRKLSFMIHRSGSAGTRSFNVRNAQLLSASTLVGGNALKPLSITYLEKVMGGWGFVGLCNKQGDAVMVKSDVQIGDGSYATYYDATATLTSMDEAYSNLLQRSVNIGANQVDVVIKASASDTINEVASSTSAALEQNYTIDSSSSTSAVYNYSGKSIIGMLVTLKTGIPITGATFSECDEIVAKGATLTNCTISSTTSTDAAIAFDTSAGTLDGCTIDVTGTSALYHLELGTACDSITLTDVTFTGTPGTDKVHVRKTTGTVTISISGTTTLSAGDVTTEGATVSIVSDPVYQVVVVSGFTAGSRIQIYDTTNTVELFNGTASAGNTVVSGTTATWTDPTAAAGNRAIRVRVAYVSGATAKDFLELTGLTAGTTSVTASITYPVTQVADTTYDDNAIDGSTVTGVTFTDSSPDVVNIDVASNAITWPSIYAAWVYYAFTSTGIATDIDYIDGIDTANYLLSNMKIKNTSSPTEPLVVSGGYGRDATTGASVDLVDTTGGTLIFAPDHVVSYAVGSGVTSQDKTDIATAVLSAAASSPIASNIKKVNDLTVDGTGTEADPWGPV